MKAVLCKSLDGPGSLVIEEIDRPLPKADELLIKVEAAALNFFDMLITQGKYQTKPELPFSPSGEIAGVIQSCGADITGFRAGDRVMAYLGYGGAREYVVARPDTVVSIPAGVAFEVAAGLAITYGTAIHGLQDRAQLAPGETVAVLGAAGGAGLAAVEVAKLMGGRVIAVASTDEKLAVAQAHGADDLVLYSNDDAAGLRAALKAASGGSGVDVVYDCIGGAAAEPAVRALAWRGRYLVVGFASGTIPKLPLNLLMVKGASAVGVFWGEAVARDPAAHRSHMQQVLRWVENGNLRPRIHGTYPLERTSEALTLIANRSAVGKIVIVP